VKEDMVEGLPALPRGVDKDLQVLLDPLLPYVFGEELGAHPLLKLDLLFCDDRLDHFPQCLAFSV
jgi:hypothetical protein